MLSPLDDLWLTDMGGQSGAITHSGLVCPNPECKEALSTPSVAVQLENQIRCQIAKFYEAWLVCDDQSCSNRTRMIAMVGKRCLKPDCRGSMHPEVSNTASFCQPRS
jgi:DNA polymerase alpha subunit A